VVELEPLEQILLEQMVVIPHLAQLHLMAVGLAVRLTEMLLQVIELMPVEMVAEVAPVKLLHIPVQQETLQQLLQVKEILAEQRLELGQQHLAEAVVVVLAQLVQMEVMLEEAE
jgi:hypothetical protein